MLNFYHRLKEKYFLVTADFKTVEKKFLDQGEDQSDVKKYLDLFKKLRDKNKLSGDEKNIDAWGKKDFKEFKKRIEELEKEKTSTEKKKGSVNLSKEIPGSKKITENDKWVVYEILTNEAAEKLGKGTEWCIRFNPSNHWITYASKNNIYYLISKTLPPKNPWFKIALLIDKKGKKSYWNVPDVKHSRVPKELEIPKFKYEKPRTWKFAGIDMDVSDLNITSLEGAPEKVDGSFYCFGNGLKSLNGAPKIVGDNFNCSNNLLTSLEGGPEKVGGDFNCSSNELKSLQGAPKEFVKNFECAYNKLESLQGAPKEVLYNFYCFRNEIESLQGSPVKVGGDFRCNRNKLKSLKGAPEKVGGDFVCSYNQLESLEGAPKEVVGYFDCTNNPKKFTEEEVRAVCDVKGIIYV